MTDNLINLLPKIRGEYRPNAKLKNWFDVGGNAEILFKPADIKDLQYFLQNCSKAIPITILGAGSNTIIKDGGVKGVVIRLGAEFAKISIKENNLIETGCATLCANVALFSRDNSLANLEFLCGIPGCIGGAIAMNAGCYDSDISKILISVTALDYNGNLYNLSNSDFNFEYRYNKIASNFIFLSAIFQGNLANKEEIAYKIATISRKREESQPIRAKTGGSTFKNPKDSPKKAWQLLDEAKMRGFEINDAKFSEKHCNFMINTNKAKASDLIKLAKHAKERVKQQSNIDLDLEIKIIGQD